MTFIASVIAKKGVAIIADSLVTSMGPIIEKEHFLNYVKSKNKDSKDNKIQIEYDEVVDLFQNKTSHTKDYEEKLFKYDDYTAITTAGNAAINDKRIADIVEELCELNNKKKNKSTYSAKTLETKVKDFCNHMTSQVKEHLRKYPSIGNTTFILTHYDKTKHNTTIFRIEILNSNSNHLNEENYKFVEYEQRNKLYKVVCDGQNRISERILFGDIERMRLAVIKMITAVASNFDIDRALLTPEKVKKIIDDSDIFDSTLLDDIKIFQLTDLSLQQAVDLACLLMRIEMDFQKYTRNIPIVGGVIKLAVIDDKGFKFVHGYDILKPDVI